MRTIEYICCSRPASLTVELAPEFAGGFAVTQTSGLRPSSF